MYQIAGTPCSLASRIGAHITRVLATTTSNRAQSAPSSAKSGGADKSITGKTSTPIRCNSPEIGPDSAVFGFGAATAISQPLRLSQLSR